MTFNRTGTFSPIPHSKSALTDTPAKNAVLDIVVIDKSVEGYENLLEGISPDAHVIMLDPDEGIAGLVDALKGVSNVSSISILSHGNVGQLNLAGEHLTTETLDDYAELLNTLISVTEDDATLHLYGCEIAKNQEGRSFIDALENKIGIAVVASETLTGFPKYNGNWELEYNPNLLNHPLPFDGKKTSFMGTLGTFSFNTASGSGTDTITETVDGVTVTITRASTIFSVSPAIVGNGVSPSALSQGDSYTISFDSAVDISSFQILEFANANDGGNYTIDVTNGNGTTITVASNAPELSDSVQVYSPADWTNVTQITVSYSGTETWQLGVDEIAFTASGPSNSAPELGGTPADDTATEDVATAIDLSAYNISDADAGDTITLTLAVDRGTIASIDTNGTFGGVTIAGSGTASMTLQGTAAALNTYLNDTSHITFTTASNDTTTAVLTVTPNDGTVNGTTDTVNISISAVNDDPAAATLPPSVTVTEDTLSNIDLGTTAFSDIDSASITVTLTASAGTFAQPADGPGVTETLVNPTTITLAGAPADINTYLDTASNIQYTGASNVSGNAAATITVTANDGNGSGNVAIGTVNVNITAANDDPAAATLPPSVTVTEDTLSNIDLGTTVFSDVDSASITVTLTASAGTFAQPADGSGVTETLVNPTTITLAGAPADINTYLDTASNIQYTGASNVSGNAAATITVTANDGNGSGNVAIGTVNVNITAVNDAPTATGIPDDVDFLEDTTSNLAIPSTLFEDVDGDNITVTITASEGTFSAPADGAGVGGGVTETLVNATTITLAGAPADINTYLDTFSNLRWTPALNDNGDNTSTFTITARDEDTSDIVLGTINADVAAANDAPTATGVPNDISVMEDTASNVDLSGVDFTDVDSTGTVFVRLTASEGTLSASSGGSVSVSGDGTSVLTLNGTLDNIETYLDTVSNVTYTGASNDSGDDAATLTIAVDDDEAEDPNFVTVGTSNFDITAVNDAPGLNAALSPTLMGISEDAGDDDNSGVDGDDDASNNTNNGGSTVASIVADGSITDVDGSAVEAIAVTAVDNTNGVWEFSVDGGSNWNAFSATSGTVDLSSASRLLSSTALVRFVPGENYSGSATITFRAWDQSSGSNGSTADTTTNGGATAFSAAADTASIAVAAVNDAPVFSNLDNTPTYTEGGSAVILDNNVSIADIELGSLNSGNGDYSGATLTIVRNGGANASDAYAFTTGGNLTVSGNNISAGGNVIATFDTGSVNGQLTVTFADNGTTPTTALVNEVLQAVRYSNSSDTPSASIQLNWTFSDGNSGDAQGTGDNPGTVTGSTTVSVTNVNDAPTLTATGGNPTFVEGGAAQDLFNTVSASTIESADSFSSMTLTVTNVSNGANEILRIDGSDVTLTNGTMVTTATNGLDVSVSVTGSTATVSFSGETLTSAQFQTLVDGLTYSNTSDNPDPTGNRVVTITDISDNGGTANGGDNNSTPNLISTVSLTAVNDAPIISGVDGESSTIVSGNGATNITLLDDASVTDHDSTDFGGGSLTISQNTGTTNGNWSVDGTTVTSGGDAIISAGEDIQVDGVTIATVDATDDGQGGNTLVLNFVNTAGDPITYSTLLQNLLYEGPSGVDSRTFTLTFNDNGGTANGGDEDSTANFTIVVSPNPPVITNLNGDSFTFTEGDSASNLDISSNLTVTDADSANFNGGDLTISVTANQEAEDRLVIDTSGNISLSAGQTAGSTVSVGGTAIGTIDSGATGGSNEDLIVSLNSNATPALVQELLRTIQYNNVEANTPTDSNRTVSITLSDGTGATSNAAEVTVNVNPVNTIPVLDTALPTDLTFTEDTSGNVDLSSSTIGDLDSTSITVTITASEGTFGTPADGGSSVVETLVNPTTITLVGSPADISTYLDTASAITWTPTANDTGNDTSTFTITANDGDGSDNVTLGTVNADITAVDDTPTATGVPSDIIVTEDTASNVDLSGVDFSAVDNPSNVTIRLTASDGTLAATSSGGVTISGSGTSVISLQGTLTNIEAYLDTASNVTYTSTLDSNGDDAAILTIAVDENDTIGFVNVSTSGIDITATNDNPAVTGLPADIEFTEDTANALDLSSLSFTDVDSNSITVTLTANEGTFSAPSSGTSVGAGVTATLVNNTTITLTGSPADISTYLDTTTVINWTPAPNDNGDNASTFTITANDTNGSGDVELGTINADITSINDIAVIRGDVTGTIAENEPGTLTGNLTSIDLDNRNDSFRADIVNGTYGQLIISADGSWGYEVNSTVDAVNQLNVGDTLTDTLQVRSEDGTPQAIVITITGSDDAPVLSGDIFGEVIEDGTPISGTISLTDVDDTDPTFPDVAPTLGANGFGVFTLTSGTWTYTPTPEGLDLSDGETATDNISFTASDGSTHVVTVTIIGVGTNSGNVSTPEDDNIRLSDADNEITLLGGEDTVDAGAGDDTVTASTEDDDPLFIDGGLGDDMITSGNGNDTIFGGGDADVVNTAGGNDLVFAGIGDMGDDSVSGSAGDDTLGGGAGNDIIMGGNDNDLIWGRQGNDTLFGGTGNDIIHNGQGNDLVEGGAGNDMLWGSAGDDTLSGGAGADAFVFGAEIGDDVITDFDTTEDTIELFDPAHDFADFAAFIGAATQDGTSVRIALADDQSILLENVSLSDLTESNVILF
ncbi:DUF4347 domain-containing protein [Kordiimonas sp. SCSIO 12603]|uniref:DUF4347 domain-containing protein n=1 Tax=Kordiimonas sp. SCSIO 12603 TaxID=2829596 RepID=UPI0021083761|nr:DUF4347 domain-containing protein [Kordiimonas sp. SCSIO 12603]UTW59413.1 DUF4347 domain-containing protein [Kordiimonas sp. SCSIO 12603]